jgi:hypothetical protein
VPGPGPGVCTVCRGPAPAGSISTSSAVCFACRLVARRLGLPLGPVVPARLCPLPSPLYTVLLGYKESPVAEARQRFGTIVRALLRAFLVQHALRLEGAVGGAIDVVALVPSTHRPRPAAPLALVAGLADEVVDLLPAARWAPALLRRADGLDGRPPVAHMRPDPAAFTVPPPDRAGLRGARVLLLDDTYVSGSRSQSAAAALQRAGARAVIGPLGRGLRPDRVARHADFLRQHVA